MEGPAFREYIRQVAEAARVGRPIPDLPAHEGSAGRSHTVTQVPAVPALAAEIARVTEEHLGPRPDTWLKAFHQMGVPPFFGKVGLEVELWIGHVDSALETIRCPTDRQIELVLTLFRDLAQHWWRSVRVRSPIMIR